MASVGVQATIAHAAVDPSFRQSFLQDASAACAANGYDLDASDLESAREVVAADNFGMTFAAGMNLPEMFQETSGLLEETAPVGDSPDGSQEII